MKLRLLLTLVCATFSAQAAQTQKIVRALITNPLLIVKQLSHLHDQMDKEFEKLDPRNAEKAFRNFQAITNKYAEKMPLSSLGECSKVNDAPCVFSRQEHPEYRQAYENAVVGALSKHITLKKQDALAHQKSVEYVSFGSGALLQDLIILTKTLAQHPRAQLSVHFLNIDHNYYFICREITASETHHSGLDRQVDTNWSFDHTILSKLRKKFPDLPHRAEEQVAINAHNQQLALKQCVTFLKQAFPEAKLAFYVHETTTDYLEYIWEKGLPHADVVAAADIADEYSLAAESLKLHALLCAVTLKNNPTADNILLIDDQETGKPELVSLSSQEEGAEETVTFTASGTDYPLHIHKNKI